MERILIGELSQGMEKAKQLHFHLSSTSPSQTEGLLLQRILSSYETALSILKRDPNEESPRTRSNELIRNPTSDHDHQECSPAKKRKLPMWTEQVRVSSENGLDGPSDDGYSWRKYGQKDILGAKYPRSYYRCTHRVVHRCWATKHVQRSDEDPNVFDLTYKGEHTCLQSNEKHGIEQNQALLNFKTNLRVSTGDSSEIQMPPQFSFPAENHDFQYSPSFLSPATSGTTSYFSAVNYSGAAFGQCSELDISGMISGQASTDNSPISGMEFPSDLFGLDPNFPYNASGFFA